MVLEGSVGRVGWSPQAEWRLQVGREVWGSSGVYGEFGVKERCLPGDAVGVCRRVVEGEGAVVELCVEEGEGGCALRLGRGWGRGGGCGCAPGERRSSRRVVAIEMGSAIHTAAVASRSALVEGDCLV